MPVAEAPDDDEVRETYNFAPGSHGLVYRADVPYYGAGSNHHGHDATEGVAKEGDDSRSVVEDPKETRYKLQAMKWGLVPFWTKRTPDYGSVMKSINARDDSLAATGGMWNTMKKGKRCIVIAQGFYEWLKKPGSKEKIPHYTKRKDGQLMCFAGLWDCVQYEGSEEKHYTYTIITTDSNKQLSFLHDRMPVILENGSVQIRNWLDPSQYQWSKELQSLLKPFGGELECYPVSKEVGKVGNNSPTFIVPVASTENKNNIANFFSNAKKAPKDHETKGTTTADDASATKRVSGDETKDNEKRATAEHHSTEDNAPLPVPASVSAHPIGSKRLHEAEDDDDVALAKMAKTEAHAPSAAPSERLHSTKAFSRSASSNGSKGSPTKSGDGSQRITRFFNK
ncbi:hypothetical protein MMC07_006975 [Pseudocyphellaria aurata]|nr:hypothetical protein [Pseudocyphellaria aurata]